MIVYPQINSLRLIVLPLVLLLLALGHYSYKSYELLKSYQDYIVNENALIEEELGNMILTYHELEIENDSILNKIQHSISKIFKIIDSIQTTKPNISLITRYKRQLETLKEENKNILGLIETSYKDNNSLKSEVGNEDSNIEQSQNYIAQYLKKTNGLY